MSTCWLCILRVQFAWRAFTRHPPPLFCHKKGHFKGNTLFVCRMGSQFFTYNDVLQCWEIAWVTSLNCELPRGREILPFSLSHIVDGASLPFLYKLFFSVTSIPSNDRSSIWRDIHTSLYVRLYSRKRRIIKYQNMKDFSNKKNRNNNVEVSHKTDSFINFPFIYIPRMFCAPSFVETHDKLTWSCRQAQLFRKCQCYQ